MREFNIVGFNMRRVNFEDCGLDIECNILQAPECECGCGKKASLVVEDNKYLAEFMEDMLFDGECEYCAIYALLKKKNLVMIGARIGDEFKCNTFGYADETIPGIEFISEWQEECGYHCYGLLEEIEDGVFRVVEE